MSAPRRLILAAVLASSCALLAPAAHAEFIAIGRNGSVERYDGPILTSSNGMRRLGAYGGSTRRAAVPSADTATAIKAAAARHQVSEKLVSAVAQQESGFNPMALSPKGARGVMQLMPGTARQLGVNPDDPAQNIDGGADYLGQMLRRFNGDQEKALAAYNAGPGAVERWQGVPPYAETQAYVHRIMTRLNENGGGGAATSASADPGVFDGNAGRYPTVIY